MPRSKPGEGGPVLLFLFGDKDHSGAGAVRGPKEDGHHSVMGVHIGEDYSTCEWPVVVKVQRGFDAEYVADRLEDLVSSLRQQEYGFWGEVPEELPDYVRRAAQEDAGRLGMGSGHAPVRVVVEQPASEDVLYQITVLKGESPKHPPGGTGA